MRTKITPFLLAFCIVTIICFANATDRAWAQKGQLQRVGEVTMVEGPATVVRKGSNQPVPISVGTVIYQADTIRTQPGGRIRIKFDDNTIISIGSDSNLTINKYVYKPRIKTRSVNIKMLWGKVKSYVNSAEGYNKRDFNISTKTAVIGVRGTTFIIDAPRGEEKTIAATFDGTVWAANTRNPRKRVEIPRDTYSEVIGNDAPSSPLAITPALFSLFHEGLLAVELTASVTSGALVGTTVPLSAAATSTAIATTTTIGTTVPTITTGTLIGGIGTTGAIIGGEDLGSDDRAGNLYKLTVNAEGQSYVREFGSALQIENELTVEEIGRNIHGFDSERSAVDATLQYRGLPVLVNYLENASDLRMQIPEIGVDITFQGATRDDSLDALKDWFKKEGGDALKRMNKWLAEHTATDPIAGNPGSMMGQMVAGAFDTGFTSIASNLQSNRMSISPNTQGPAVTTNMFRPSGQVGDAGSGQYGEDGYFDGPYCGYRQPIDEHENLIEIGASVGYVKSGDSDGIYVSLPFSYSWRWSEDPRAMWTFKVPISLITIGGGRSYNIGLGTSVSLPVTDSWVITPGVEYGFLTAVEFGTLSHMLTGSITSSYTWDLGQQYYISMGNMIGISRSLPLDLGNYDISPDITSYPIRNALMLSIPTDGIVKGSMIEPFFIDTRYFGDKLKVDSYEEIGINFGLSKFGTKSKNDKLIGTFSNFRIGGSYTWGQDYQVIKASVGLVF